MRYRFIFVIIILIFNVNIVNSYYNEFEENLHINEDINEELPSYVPNVILVKFKDNAYAEERDAFEKINEIKSNSEYLSTQEVESITKIVDNLDLYKIVLENEDVNTYEIIEELERNEGVEYAEPNYIHYINFVPNDPLYERQWHHQNIQSEDAWEVEQGDEEVVIAVIDTGVDLDHEDLEDNLVQGYDFVNLEEFGYENECHENEDCIEEDDNPNDFHGHGTHVAGIAAAVTNNEIGVAGVCPNCKIMPLRAGWKTNNGGGALLTEDVIQAINYAADNGADIISMSFGGYNYSEADNEAIQYAYSQGVVLIASAGNSNNERILYPAGFDNVIAVATTDQNNRKASFSSYGDWVDISAPGVDIMSTFLNNRYIYLSGTSMSAPVVAGVAGLVKSHNQEWNNLQIVAQIMSTTDNINDLNPLYLNQLGAGRVNAYNSLSEEPHPNILILNFNDEGEYEQGERITLEVTLKNYGWDAENVIASLSTDSEDIEIIEGDADYGNINFYEEETRSFSFDIINPVVRPSIFRFNLNINAEDYSNTYEINIEIPPDIQEGWPVSIGDSMIAEVIIDNIDNDEDNTIETVVVTEEYVYLFDYAGEGLDGWPQRLEQEGRIVSGGATLTDIDNDGRSEIIVINKYGIIRAFDIEGNILWGLNRTGRYYGGLTLTVADLDNDGYSEIIFPIYRERYRREWFLYIDILSSDGENYGDWPINLGRALGPWYHQNSISVGDLDGDGDLELVVFGEHGLKAFHHDGREMWRYSFSIREMVQPIYEPVIGDINNDGNQEIAFMGSDSNLYILNSSGHLLEGFPRDYQIDYRHYQIDYRHSILPIGKISLGNFDDDEELEIVFGGSFEGFNNIYVVNHDGSILEGWPLTLNTEFTGGYVIGDVDVDGLQEIIINEINGIYVINDDGSISNGWPISEYRGWSIPTITDLDNDGDVEIIFTGVRENRFSYVIAYDLPYNIGRLEWPQFQHDAQHTGNYNYFLIEGNYLPVVESATISPIPAYTIDDLTCENGRVYDRNGDEVTLSYEWYENNELQEELTTQTISSENTERGESWKCAITPNDGEADGNKVESDLLIISNSLPVLDFIEDIWVVESDLVIISLSASDVDGDELSFSFSEPLDENGEWQTGFDDAGTYVVTVNVDDGNGGNDNQEVTIIVHNDLDEDGIPDYDDPDDDNDGINDDEDNVIGNVNNVVRNIEDLSLTIGGSLDLNQIFEGIQTVVFMENNEELITFDFNFDESVLNLGEITIEKQEGGDIGYILVEGITLSEDNTKTVYIGDLNEDVDSVCVKDAEINIIGDVSDNCNEDNEFIVICDGNDYNRYVCNDLGDRYEIIGLIHSGVIEQAPCVESWSCTEWSACSSGTQTRTCTDLNSCGTENNKPAESQGCNGGGSSGGSSGGGGGGSSGGGSSRSSPVIRNILNEENKNNVENSEEVGDIEEPQIEEEIQKEQNVEEEINKDVGFFKKLWNTLIGGDNLVTGQVIGSLDNVTMTKNIIIIIAIILIVVIFMVVGGFIKKKKLIKKQP